MAKQRDNKPKTPLFPLLVRQPDLWPALGRDELERFVTRLCLAFGVTNDPALAQPLERAYDLAVEKLSVDTRLRILQQVTRQTPSSPLSGRALLIFIRRDPEERVISSASLDLAALMPLEGDDPLTGPRTLLALAESLPPNGTAQIGVLHGLFLLGDRRTMPLLRHAWRLLDAEGRSALTRARSGFVYASMVDLFMEWLETAIASDDDNTVGAIAGSFWRLPFDTLAAPKPGQILDVERRFPARATDPDPGVTTLRAWSVEEYGGIIAPGLRDLTEREHHPRLLPAVLRAWGIDPPDLRPFAERAPALQRFMQSQRALQGEGPWSNRKGRP